MRSCIIVSRMKNNSTDVTDLCDIQPNLFEPDEDDLEIENDSTESLVTANHLPSKSVSSPLPYHVVICCYSCHKQNINYTCMMCWRCTIYIMLVGQRASLFRRWWGKSINVNLTFQTNIASSVHDTAPNYISQ